MKQSDRCVVFDEPGCYRIRVSGNLDPSRSDVLGGMAIATRRPAGKPPATTLTGELQDQAALMGVLNTLYDSGYAIIEVKRLSPLPTAAA